MSSSGKITPTIVDDFVAPPCAEFVEILYQDDDVLIINKPSGLFSLSGKNPLNVDSVHHRLVLGQPGVTAPFPTAILPHRLDLGTSGVMIVGLNAEASKCLNKQFQEREVQKKYHAMLYGWLANDEGHIKAAIAKDSQLFPMVKICQQTGKPAVTKYKVIQRLEHPQRSIVQYTPITGRTHQLRIHSLTIEHPILGCDLYKNPHSEQMAERLMLHASDLYFKHPTSGELIHAHSPSPF